MKMIQLVLGNLMRVYCIVHLKHQLLAAAGVWGKSFTPLPLFFHFP